MAKAETKVTEKPEKVEEPVKVAPPGANRLDMDDKDVKMMITKARKSGLLSTTDLNQYIDMKGITTEDIEVTLAQLSDLGISVIDDKEDETMGPKTLARTSTKAVKGGNSKEGLDRTDDPVRMYLREMGTVELLSREGEIAIAKRIEAGRDTMIKGLCESALTFEAIMVWREELAEGQILLRDIIDLDTTYNRAIGNIQKLFAAKRSRKVKSKRLRKKLRKPGGLMTARSRSNGITKKARNRSTMMRRKKKIKQTFPWPPWKPRFAKM